MFKVECPGCKAPYQVDERRVPPNGLKMRCPKCGSSFQVDPPPSDPRDTSPAPVLGAVFGGSDSTPADAPAAPPLPKKKPAMKGTMIGVAPPKAPGPANAPPEPSPPAAAAPPAAPRAPVAPAAPVRAEPAFDDLPVPKAPAPAKDPFADLDLPAVAAKPAVPARVTIPKPAGAPAAAAPAAKPPLPGRATVPKPAGPAAPSALAPAFDDADLPAPLAPRAAAPAGGATGLPAPRPGGIKGPPPRATLPRPGGAAGGAAGARPAAPAVEADLPMPRAAAPAADPFANLDLPATRDSGNPTPAVAPAFDPHAFDDLPVAARARGDVKPGNKTTLPSGGARDDSAAMEADLDVDLPSPSYGIDLPSPVQADLPSLASAGVAPNSAGLPALARGGSGGSSGSGGGGFGELDLPMIGADLPSPAAGLPMPAAGLPARSPVGLPAPAAGLPMPAAGLPSPATAGLPAQAAGLPSPASIPPFSAEGDPFSGNAAQFDSADPFGGPASDPFGHPTGDPFSEGGDPFAGANAFGAGDTNAFGATAPFGTPGHSVAPTPFSVPPRERLDSFGEAASGEFGGDGFDAADIPPPPRHDPDQPLVRQAGGGVAYGEVNLSDTGGGGVAIEGHASEAPPPVSSGEGPISGSGAEFEGLPTEASHAPTVARDREAPGAGSAVAEIQARRRRKRVRAIVATAVATALVGGALTLIPSVGPFGAYFIVDQVRSGEYERLLTGASDTAHKALGADTYPDAELAANAVAQASASARRYKPLAAYSAFIGFARMLRFGSEPANYAHAKISLDELEGTADVDKLPLARATRAAVDGEIARARELLTAIQQKAPKDADAAVTRAEVELRAKDAAAAVGAWTSARELEKSARTAYGLARAEFAAGNLVEAQKLIAETLALNPKHVGARFVSAEIVWGSKRDEAAALKLLDEILKAPENAGPEERIDAFTLTGQIHLNRGRISQAEQSFGDAIKLAELIKTNAKASRALSGLGEALFRAARYSQAIARFKAAVQADPDDVVAQLGVAKSSLELEQLEDARDMLTKLHKNYPKVMLVSYWYGRVEDALGDRKEAETAYRDAISLGKDDPEAVQAYISLAAVQSQIGQLDAANATLEGAQKHLPESPALFKALGRLAMTQGRYADAKTAFEKSLSLDGEDLEAKFLVGTAMTRLHDFDHALDVFDAVAKVDRDFPGLALERGILFQESGRTEEALREYEGALAKAPTDPDLMLKVGCGKAAAGNGAEAEKLLRKVLEQRQSSAETHYCLGRALMDKDNIVDALKAFERAVQIDPNRAEYYLYVGWASNDAGNVTKAGNALKKALELDQGLADAYWQRGVLRVRMTRSKDAVEDLTKALQLRPSRYEAHADLALAYNDLGKEDLALAEWQKAIAAKPDVATWRFHYGKLLSLRLQNAAAAEQLQKAIELSEAKGSPDAWLSEAHRLAAQSLGNVPASIPHWQAFLKTGAADSPYRAEAKTALKRLGAAWSED